MSVKELGFGALVDNKVDIIIWSIVLSIIAGFNYIVWTTNIPVEGNIILTKLLFL